MVIGAKGERHDGDGAEAPGKDSSKFLIPLLPAIRMCS
jgi:hypothetical protein